MWVCGEALIDLLPDKAVVGGGPANTARALARLGSDVEFIGGISQDGFGKSIRKVFRQDGVKLSYALDSTKATCTAKVALDKSGVATYEFHIAETATFDFKEEWLPDPSRFKPNLLHIGTLATIIEPGCQFLYEWAIKVAEFAPIVFDPNIRTTVLADREAYRASVEKWVGLSTVVKLSEEDLIWLFPGQDPIAVAYRWVAGAIAIVLITRGSAGITAITATERIDVAGVKVDVIDTVGAGDTVGAVIAQALVKDGVVNLVGEKLRSVLDCAVVAAAITCSRAGAEPPTQYELADAIERRK